MVWLYGGRSFRGVASGDAGLEITGTHRQQPDKGKNQGERDQGLQDEPSFVWCGWVV